MDSQAIVRAFGALAQGTRLAAFRALVASGPDGQQPTQLAAALGVPANTLSFHLKELLAAGLITQERSGRALVYRADLTRVLEIIDFLTQSPR